MAGVLFTEFGIAKVLHTQGRLAQIQPSCLEERDTSADSYFGQFRLRPKRGAPKGGAPKRFFSLNFFLFLPSLRGPKCARLEFSGCRVRAQGALKLPGSGP